MLQVADKGQDSAGSRVIRGGKKMDFSMGQQVRTHFRVLHGSDRHMHANSPRTKTEPEVPHRRQGVQINSKGTTSCLAHAYKTCLLMTRCRRRCLLAVYSAYGCRVIICLPGRCSVRPTTSPLRHAAGRQYHKLQRCTIASQPLPRYGSLLATLVRDNHVR